MQVYLFAAAKDLAGKEMLDLHVAFPISASGLKDAIAGACPNLKELVVHSRIAVDGQYIADQATIGSANEVALIPPVSGG